MAQVVEKEAPSGLVEPAFWSDRRVLLTGHTGFKGAWLALWLQMMGARVAGLASGVPTSPSLYELARVADELEHFEADVRDYDAVSGVLARCSPDVVIHMAAQSLVRVSFEDPRGTYATNVMGTVNVFDAVRHCDAVRVVVNVTSDKCYENREWEWGYREDEPKGGHDPYSNSKGCAELVTDAFRRSFFSVDSDGVRLASARAGNVIGGGDWAIDRLIPDMMRAALDGIPLRVRNPHAIRPWQHVLCPLSGYLVLAQGLWESATFADGWNFGPADEDARPVQWIVEQTCGLWPEPLHWETEPGPHPHEARYLKLDSSRARGRLGWRPAWGLEEALENVIAWYGALRRDEDIRAATLGQIERYVHDQAATAAPEGKP